MHVIKVMCKKGLYTLCAEFILTQRSHFLVFYYFVIIFQVQNMIWVFYFAFQQFQPQLNSSKSKYE